MRNESSSTTTRDVHPVHHAHTPRGAKDKQDPVRGREEVQRFRKLMDGTVTQHGKDGEETVSGTTVTGHKSLQEQEQALRDLLQRQLDAAGDEALALPPRGDGDDHQEADADSGQDNDQGFAAAGPQALHQAQQVLLQTAEQPAPAMQAALSPALAELIERHVKQLLVPDANSRSSAQAREIMITLKNGVLPGAELWLSRTDKGWKLRADMRGTEAYRQLLESAPQLIERFASKQLGELEIDPVLLS
ncbi:hypothetical protein SAMN05216570_0930 [Dyella sp. OK004]|uniref:hypothetical protein n=1 Tax=Dyella sp. OK004 TaxID=1855292 RepID=UPI0008E93C73|nr:hypothetical protein [Dyella sp. OK004]SFR94082.1 hypothetical protein SAMN05216570_0930 [Dyella sp. OK004]